MRFNGLVSEMTRLKAQVPMNRYSLLRRTLASRRLLATIFTQDNLSSLVQWAIKKGSSEERLQPCRDINVVGAATAGLLQEILYYMNAKSISALTVPAN